LEEPAHLRRLEHGQIILGLIAGFIAGKILNRAGSGLILDLVLGMVGAAVGGFIFSGLFGMTGITGVNIWSIIHLGGWRDYRAVGLREADCESLTRSVFRRQPVSLAQLLGPRGCLRKGLQENRRIEPCDPAGSVKMAICRSG
jgi:uncharacterized membrane protein YeaQ/YmgE (transglycosylase-associated protein family)